jgi:hypothetical protein
MAVVELWLDSSDGSDREASRCGAGGWLGMSLSAWDGGHNFYLVQPRLIFESRRPLWGKNTPPKEFFTRLIFSKDSFIGAGWTCLDRTMTRWNDRGDWYIDGRQNPSYSSWWICLSVSARLRTVNIKATHKLED